MIHTMTYNTIIQTLWLWFCVVTIYQFYFGSNINLFELDLEFHHRDHWY